MLKISRSTLERILKATKWVERHMQNTGVKRARWQPRGSGQRIIFGKLKSALAYDDTDPTGVDVDVYSDEGTDAGYDIENVLPLPWMTEGTLPSGLWVEVVSWGGSHYAIDPYMPLGDSTNDILYWNATTKRWVVLDAPSTSGTWALTVTSGTMGWTEFQDFSCP